MKKLFTVLLISLSLKTYCQTYDDELIELRRQMNTELSKINTATSSGNALVAATLGKYQELENKLNAKWAKINQQKQIDDQNRATSEAIIRNNINDKLIREHEQKLRELNTQQQLSRYNYQTNLNSSLQSLSQSLQNIAVQQTHNELSRRIKVADTYTNQQINFLNYISERYNQIPKEAFNKNLNGHFNAFIIEKRNYSFIYNDKFLTITPVVININDNVIKNIYLYGKIQMELNYPEEQPHNSIINYGHVEYFNRDQKDFFNIVILDAYTSELSTSPEADNVSFVRLWTNKKDDENKIIYIQELNKDGSLFREVSVPLKYAKNENSLDSSIPKIPLNSNRELLFFGEPTKTQFGYMPLYPRMNKKDSKKLNPSEERNIQIIKYRD